MSSSTCSERADLPWLAEQRTKLDSLCISICNLDTDRTLLTLVDEILDILHPLQAYMLASHEGGTEHFLGDRWPRSKLAGYLYDACEQLLSHLATLRYDDADHRNLAGIEDILEHGDELARVCADVHFILKPVEGSCLERWWFLSLRKMMGTLLQMWVDVEELSAGRTYDYFYARRKAVALAASWQI